MNWLKRFSYITTLAGLLALSSEPSAFVKAQLAPSSVSGHIPSKWEDTFHPPTGMGEPDSRVGGTTRGGCIKDKDKDIVALVPATAEGVTVAEQPTFVWFVPATNAQEVEFNLEDKNGRKIYSNKIGLAANQQGIMSLKLPSSATPSPLEIDQQYLWSVSLICNKKDRTEDIHVGGWIQRVKPDARLSQGEASPLPDRLVLYTQSRIWYDAVATLVELNRLHPNDQALKDNWAKLLKSVGLNEIAQEPVVVQSEAAQGKTELPQNSTQLSSPTGTISAQ